MNLVDTIKLQNVNELDGILFEDIKDLLNNKESIENVLFATKVIFLNNEELIEFMNKLFEFGYEDMALDYVESLYDRVSVDFSNLKTFNANKTK